MNEEFMNDIGIIKKIQAEILDMKYWMSEIKKNDWNFWQQHRSDGRQKISDLEDNTFEITPSDTHTHTRKRT